MGSALIRDADLGELNCWSARLAAVEADYPLGNFFSLAWRYLRPSGSSGIAFTPLRICCSESWSTLLSPFCFAVSSLVSVERSPGPETLPEVNGFVQLGPLSRLDCFFVSYRSISMTGRMRSSLWGSPLGLSVWFCSGNRFPSPSLTDVDKPIVLVPSH